jgi:hypothetical protein
VKGNFHAPFWNSGRRSDPPIDCDGTRPIIWPKKNPSPLSVVTRENGTNPCRAETRADHTDQDHTGKRERENPKTHRYTTPVALPARSSSADVPREAGHAASRWQNWPPLPAPVIRCGFPGLATIIRRGLKASRPCSLRSSKRQKKTLISRLTPASLRLFLSLRAWTHTPSGLGLLGEKTTKTG